MNQRESGTSIDDLIDRAVAAINRGDRAAASALARQVPTDPGFVLHELPLLRLRALLARGHGDEAGYGSSPTVTARWPIPWASRDIWQWLGP